MDPFRQRSNAIKIRSQTHMVYASDFGDVVYVIDQRLQRRTRELRGPLLPNPGGFIVRYRAAIKMRMRLLISFHFGVALLDFLRIGRRLAVILIDKSRIEIYHYHAAIVGHGPKHVIGHVTW